MYQALYRKYRPQTFDDVVGQRSVTQTLKKQLTSDKLSHAYLFTGSRGTGKTSCAKILAKAVNCEHPVDGNPCNACPACRSIDAGSCLEVLEIDAASNNGVDQVRALRDEAIYSPASVRKRVYIIDEVHMLSLSAFNALLKIIEEPPEHLLFILATTELHKVPATILSRCQRFSFRRLTMEDIAQRINYVCYQENIEIEPDAISLLSRLADGALRDGLSLLDQCASAAPGAVTADTVAEVLGLAGAQQTAQMLSAVADHDSGRLLQLFDGLYADGKSISAMLDELCSLARDLLILKTAPKSGVAMLTGIATTPELQQLLPRFSAPELLRIVTVLQQTMFDFSKSVNQRTDAELCLLELTTPALQLDAAALSARLGRLEEAFASGMVPVQQPAVKSEAPPWDEELPPPPDDAGAPPPSPGEPDSPPQAANDETPVGFWPDLVKKVVAEAGPQTRMYCSDLTGTVSGNTLKLVARTPLMLQQIQRLKLDALFGAKAAGLLGRPVSVTLSLPDAAQAESNGKLDDLLAFGNQHSHLINIKNKE